MLVTWAVVAMGQTQTSTQNVVLTNKSIDTQSNLHSLFFILSVNNERNINQLKINISYNQLIDNTIDKVIKISWNNVSISGDLFFRDFNFDTLITPDSVNIKLSRQVNHKDYFFQQQFKSYFPVKNLIIKPYGYKGEKISVHLNWYLSHNKFKKFVTATRIANTYYGAYSVLKTITTNDKNSDEISYYLNYIEIYRALHLIKQQNLINFLNLKQHDPVNFLPLYKKAKRQEIRARTLALQQMDKKAKNDNKSELFARALVKLSVDFLKEKSRFQPYLAGTYQKMAYLADDTTIFRFYSRVCNRFDIQNQNSKTCAQKVFDEFIAQAARYEHSQTFTNSLVMLENADVWAKAFTNVKNEPTFINQLSRTIDGIMASYLKVATVSLTGNNREMGLQYIDKANTLYNIKTNHYPALLKKPLVRFQAALLQIANKEVNKLHFRDALNLLSLYKNLQYDSLQQKDRLRIISLAYKGEFSQYVEVAKTALDNGYIDEAYRRMMEIKNFRNINSRYLSDDTTNNVKLEKVAYGLILEFIQRGEILMDQNRSNEAMNSFGIAMELQNGFLSYRIDRLDKLMNQTAIPVLLKKIEKAEFLVWSNKMDEARKLTNEIERNRTHYHLESNPRISNRIAALKLKLNNRKCVDANYSLSNYLQVAKNRIHSGKWQEATVAMENAHKILITHKSCQLDSSVYIKLKENYNDVFKYITAYNKAKSNLYAYGYDSVWKRLADLDNFYQTHHLSDLRAPKPGQYETLKSQHNNQNIVRIVNYYLSLNNSRQAYRYLLLLKDSDLPIKSIRKLQKDIGKQMAINISPEEFNNIVDTSDRWLRTLIDSYKPISQ